MNLQKASTGVGQHRRFEEDPIGLEKPVTKYTCVNQIPYCSEKSLGGLGETQNLYLSLHQKGIFV